MNAVDAMIEAAEKADFTRAFPSRPFAIRHRLAGNPLFSLPSIVDLVRKLPADSIEYNSGKVSIGQDAKSVPVIDLDPAEVVRRIETCGAWMVLKCVEAVPAYRAVIEQTLLSVARARMNGNTDFDQTSPMSVEVPAIDRHVSVH